MGQKRGIAIDDILYGMSLEKLFPNQESQQRERVAELLMLFNDPKYLELLDRFRPSRNKPIFNVRVKLREGDDVAERGHYIHFDIRKDERGRYEFVLEKRLTMAVDLADGEVYKTRLRKIAAKLKPSQAIYAPYTPEYEGNQRIIRFLQADQLSVQNLANEYPEEFDGLYDSISSIYGQAVEFLGSF